MTPEVRVGDAFLIDSNVFIDVATRDSEWFNWSRAIIADCLRAGPTHINPVIYSEISARFGDPRELDLFVPTSTYKRLAIPYSAAYLAGHAHVLYRRRGGIRTATLPDFFIGAHALVGGLTIVTRDARRYCEAFPQVRVVAP